MFLLTSSFLLVFSLYSQLPVNGDLFEADIRVAIKIVVVVVVVVVVVWSLSFFGRFAILFLVFLQFNYF